MLNMYHQSIELQECHEVPWAEPHWCQGGEKTKTTTTYLKWGKKFIDIEWHLAK